jgi:hypothetical protein
MFTSSAVSFPFRSRCLSADRNRSRATPTTIRNTAGVLNNVTVYPSLRTFWMVSKSTPLMRFNTQPCTGVPNTWASSQQLSHSVPWNGLTVLCPTSSTTRSSGRGWLSSFSCRQKSQVITRPPSTCRRFCQVSNNHESFEEQLTPPKNNSVSRSIG